MKPTVGRVVLFKANNPDLMGTGGSPIVPALVTHVHSDTCVNLMVMPDGWGSAPVGVTSMTLSDDIEAHDSAFGPAWGWMAYQKDVAAGKAAPVHHAGDAPSALAREDAAAEAAGKGAPRVTLKSIEARIREVEYLRAGPYKLLTICVLTMANGFTVTGESACVSLENFNEEFGRLLAHKEAVNKAWALEAYLLAERLAGQRFD